MRKTAKLALGFFWSKWPLIYLRAVSDFRTVQPTGPLIVYLGLPSKTPQLNAWRNRRSIKSRFDIHHYAARVFKQGDDQGPA